MISNIDILNASILIVDDQKANVDVLEQMLDEGGYQHVSSTMDPFSVCALHRADQYDLILLDLQMPGMDGFQVMKELKKNESEGYVPILVITAQPGHKLEALKAGAKDFISKPFDLMEVKVRIYNMLEVRLLYKELSITATAFESQEGLIITDAIGTILRVNLTFTQLTGYGLEEVLGQPVSMLKSGKHDALFYQAMWASINLDGRWLGEIWDKRKNGEVFPARMLISAVKNPEGITSHYVGSFLDNTLQKQTETALLEAKVAADKANMSKSRFLAAASHDLRQPLAALSLYVDVLNKKNQSDDRGLGAKIQGCVSTLSELLNDLLDVSKLDAGVVTPKLSDFPINDLLQAMVTMHSPEAVLKGLRLYVRPSNWIGRTDFQIMQRILGNLVSNAIRYTYKGGILIGCRHYQGSSGSRFGIPV